MRNYRHGPENLEYGLSRNPHEMLSFSPQIGIRLIILCSLPGFNVQISAQGSHSYYDGCCAHNRSSL